jgi:hypothetical protein
MKNLKIMSFLVLALGLNACSPPKQIGSRLKSGTTSSASVSLLQTSDAAGGLVFVHNHPDVGPDNYKLSALTVTVPSASGAVTIEAAATKVALPPLKFGISMVANASPRKLSCQSAGIPMGTSSITCLLEGGSEIRDVNLEVANHVINKKVDIKTALDYVKQNVLKGQAIAPAIESNWLELEKEAKPGGGYFGVQEAIARTIQSWNSSVQGFKAEEVASVLVTVYKDSTGASGGSAEDLTKRADREISKYLVEQPGAKISEAIYFVQTNILNAVLPASVTKRWNDLESGIGGYNGDVDAITGEIRSWNVDIGYNAEEVARKLSQVYR